jgi:hypothetical protein
LARAAADRLWARRGRGLRGGAWRGSAGLDGAICGGRGAAEACRGLAGLGGAGLRARGGSASAASVGSFFNKTVGRTRKSTATFVAVDGKRTGKDGKARKLPRRRVVGDVIEIGARLTECKGRCGHGGWLPWLEREFGWSDQTARNFIHVFELSLTEFKTILNLPEPIDIRDIYLLAAPSTPEPAEIRLRKTRVAGSASAAELAHQCRRLWSAAWVASAIASFARNRSTNLSTSVDDVAASATTSAKSMISASAVASTCSRSVPPSGASSASARRSARLTAVASSTAIFLRGAVG